MNIQSVEDIAVASQERRPVLAVRHGRGRTGGSTFMDLLIQRARAANRLVIVGDGDRRNATLASLYPPGTAGGATQPVSDEIPDVKDWITSLAGEMAESRASLILDLGGGDRVLAEYGRELALPVFCESVGVEPLSIYMIGPDMEDFDHILTIYRAGYFRTERSILVMNESLVRAGKTARGAFDVIVTRPECRELAEEGTKFLFMPRLPCMVEMRDSGLSFYDAAKGKRGCRGKPMDPVRQFMVRSWLDEMERVFEKIGILEWLP